MHWFFDCAIVISRNLVQFDRKCPPFDYMSRIERKIGSFSTSLLSLSSTVSVSRTENDTNNEFGTRVYNSSRTPDYLPWNTYNYCNAPHINLAHYTKPERVVG